MYTHITIYRYSTFDLYLKCKVKLNTKVKNVKLLLNLFPAVSTLSLIPSVGALRNSKKLFLRLPA